jgi:hypothetical protein
VHIRAPLLFQHSRRQGPQLKELLKDTMRVYLGRGCVSGLEAMVLPIFFAAREAGSDVVDGARSRHRSAIE